MESVDGDGDEEEEEEEVVVAVRVEDGVLQATWTAPSETQEARSCTADGSWRLNVLTIPLYPNLRGGAGSRGSEGTQWSTLSNLPWTQAWAL